MYKSMACFVLACMAMGNAMHLYFAVAIQARSPDNNVGHMTEDDALSCAQSSNLMMMCFYI